MARLIIRAKDYGTHLFIVQLRSVKDGKCLPGIKLGDIGLKFAYDLSLPYITQFNSP